MEDNKYNKFYAKKPVNELIEQLFSHKIERTRLAEDWYEALKIHLDERELSNEQKKMVNDIISTDPDTLKKDLGMLQRDESLHDALTRLLEDS